MSSIVEIINGNFCIVGGPTSVPAEVTAVRLRIECETTASYTTNYGVDLSLFSNISSVFVNALRLEVQLDFQDGTTAEEDGVSFGLWVDNMVKKTRNLRFAFPCEVFMVITDEVIPLSDQSGDLVSVEQIAALELLQHKGELMQIGVTGS